MTDCAVIGGGVAGLSAAVRIAARGRSVTLIEARPRTGGRACAFRDSVSGDIVDNGQHIMMGCYTALLDYMQTIGTRERLAPVRNMRVPFLSSGGPPAILKAVPLPWPLDALSAFMGFDALPFGKRPGLLRVVAKAALMPRDSMHALDAVSVRQWLEECGQDTEQITKLWEPIVLATMNATLDDASAFLFAVVLKDAFLAGKEASTFLLPETDLSSLLADPGAEFIRNNGGEVLLHTPVQAIERAGNSWRVRTGDASIDARTVITAVPPKAYAAIAERSPALYEVKIDTEAFIPSLILSAHVWTRKELTSEVMTGFHGTTSQWLFPRGMSNDGTYRYAVVVSAANHLKDTPNDAVQEVVMRELQALYSLGEDDIVRIKIIREHAATFLPKPGMEARRPRGDMFGNGLFIAGDWTAVHLPATLEGAARSGHFAADAALRSLQLLTPN